MSESERKLSAYYHGRYTPVLISPKLLRDYGCGQVDISYIENQQIILVEAKSSILGIKSYYKKQKNRLVRSASLIQSLIDIPVKLKIIAKR